MKSRVIYKFKKLKNKFYIIKKVKQNTINRRIMTFFPYIFQSQCIVKRSNVGYKNFNLIEFITSLEPIQSFVKVNLVKIGSVDLRLA